VHLLDPEPRARDRGGDGDVVDEAEAHCLSCLTMVAGRAHHRQCLGKKRGLGGKPEVTLTLQPNLCLPQRRNNATFQISDIPSVDSTAMNEARLSHLPFWGPSEGFFLID